MEYKIETRYSYGWDDAEWTEELDGIATPLRFETIDCAQTALEEFFSKVREAVVAGHMDSEEDSSHYRIVVADGCC